MFANPCFINGVDGILIIQTTRETVYKYWKTKDCKLTKVFVLSYLKMNPYIIVGVSPILSFACYPQYLSTRQSSLGIPLFQRHVWFEEDSLNPSSLVFFCLSICAITCRFVTTTCVFRFLSGSVDVPPSLAAISSARSMACPTAVHRLTILRGLKSQVIIDHIVITSLICYDKITCNVTSILLVF